ncbi:sialic acid-binding Ig-like lectin 5 isoform X1 [Rattus norvegicus]|uniref:Sialic acid binding Ig-like lectin 5 n=1 Tax=Rattus norvegicus TaxID=10116 RepID=D3Z9T4_RAT|nr:sialic acid-binding Ig-like lectin 5 isoform X1 [Rattus norvegicus]|eukprot:XP_006229008.1 PREDICTED: sialic acid-binding Ig-like lectin 5 isoform X3 [Rattus norvegicus]
MLWAQLLPLLWAGSLAVENYELSLTESVTVQEGLCVFVPCQVKYPASGGSVFGYWFQDGANTNLNSPVATNDPHRPVQQETQGRFYLVGGIDTKNCSLDIRDARKSDTGKYFFRLDGSVKYSFRNRMLSVHVTALTKTPNLQVTSTLVSGTSTRVICSVLWACEQGTPPIFSWMSSALTSLGRRTILSSELNLTPRPQDNGTNLICQVTFPGAGVTVERTQQLSVTYAPQKLTIRVSWGDGTETKVLQSGASLQIQEGESLRLVCVADSNPSAMLSWKRQTQKNFRLSKGDELQLPRVELEDQGKYICQAKNSLGTQTASVSLSIRSLLQLLAPSCSWDSEGLHCSCSSRAWPAPSLGWRLGEGLLEGNSSNASFTVMSSSAGPWVNSSLSLSVEFSTDHRLSCEAWNDYGVQRATIVLVPGQGVSQADKSETSGGAVQGAIWGAGLMALLAVSFCLIFFIVKFLRKKSALEVAAMEGNHLAKNLVSTINSASMISSNIPLRYPIQDHLNESESQTQKEEPPLATAPDIPKDEPELHYASLSFQGPRPQQPKNTETIKSVYTEIKIHKR